MAKRARKRKDSSSGTVLAPGIEVIATKTFNYYDNDFVVEVHVGEEVFKVASSRLRLHSPVFEEMFSLPHPDGIKSVTLHSEVDEFKDYLWFLHADPFIAKDFFESAPSADKCTRLLGIANVAHMYDAHDPARRAVNEAMKMLMASERPFHVDGGIARRILSFANRIYGDPAYQSANILNCLFDQMCDVVCDAMYPHGEWTSRGPLATDPIVAVKLAQQTENKDVLAHAYFYVLRKGDAYWLHDKRLDAVDRKRILCGSHTLYSPFRAPPPPPSPGPVRFGWDDTKVHADIAGRRDSLWGYFDCDPWNLNQE